MKIELREITVRELSNGYTDNTEGGVTGYGGKLDIRPPPVLYKTKNFVLRFITRFGFLRSEVPLSSLFATGGYFGEDGDPARDIHHG